MKSIYNFGLIIFALSIINTSYGQVQFGIDYQAESQLYVVGLKPNAAINAPFNTIGTAQLTIKFQSTDSFQVSNIMSLIPNVSWNKTIRVNRPTEAGEYDYITFGLTSLGTTHIPFEKDSITELFTFENIGGKCPGIVEIIDNASDAFLYPNSEKLSIKNHISLLATGGNAFLGTYQGEASCKTPNQISTSTTDLENLEIRLFPNPATDWLEVNFQQIGNDLEFIMIYDALGKKMLMHPIQKGQNQQTIDISDLGRGVYFLRLEGVALQSDTLSFVKID